MPRDGKDKTPSAKTAILRKSNEFTDHLFRKLCNEQAFPKRSRWLFSGKIADLANDYMTCINVANEIRVVTPKEREARHYYQTMALARLQALDAKINQAGRVLEINPDTMEFYAGLANECKRLLMAWINSDNKRYGLPAELCNTEGDGQH